MSEALSTIRVVDFGHYVAGPLAAMLLADAGADVIHVDPPGFVPSDPADAFYNRNKRRLTLDLSTVEGRQRAAALIAEADVVIENFRPDVMARFGLDAERMCSANPALVYCSLPGFAPGDRRAELPGWEGIVQASHSGYRTLANHYYTDTSTIVVDDPERPLFNPVPLASNLAGMMGATAIMMALIARQRSGLGQSICLPLSEAMIEVLNIRIDFPEFGLASVPGSVIGKYKCSDGRFLDLMAFPFRFVEWIVEHLGLGNAWRREGLLDAKAVVADPSLMQKVERRLVELFASRPSDEWERMATELKVPLALVRTPAEWLRTPFALESLSIVELEDPLLGTVRTAGLAVNFSDTPSVIKPRHLPGADAAFNARSAVAPRSTGDGSFLTHALEGFWVVDVSTQVAGPTVGRILADFGAQVVKINHPDTEVLVAHVNRGKKTALVDVQKPQGREILLDLVERSDIYLHSFAKEAPDRYGIGLADLRARCPSLIHCSVSAYSYAGEWGSRRGYEMEGQAATGLQAHYGGANHWPLNHPMLVNDVGTGILGAFGVAVALFHRTRTGATQEINVSLAQTCTIHQGQYLISKPGERELASLGVDARGWDSFHRLYRASDGWFFLAVGARQRELLLDVLGIDQKPWPTGGLETLLEAQFVSHPIDYWTKQLNGAGIAAHRVIASSTEAASHLAHRKRGIVKYDVAPSGESILHTGVGPWLSRTPPAVQVTSAPFGADIAAILQGLGRADEMDRLREGRVIALQGPHVIGHPDQSSFAENLRG